MPSSGSTLPIYKVKAVEYATYSDFFFVLFITFLIEDSLFMAFMKLEYKLSV